jgi:hypothetical protein
MRTRRPNALSYEADERLVGSRREHGERGMRHVEAREWPNPAAVKRRCWRVCVLVRIEGCRQTETRSDSEPEAVQIPYNVSFWALIRVLIRP